MQFVLLNNQLIQAGPDAPKEARCPKCGREVRLYDSSSLLGRQYWYEHVKALHARNCKAAYDKAKKELDRILRIDQ